MPDMKEIVKALDELWQGFADTLRLRHEYDPNDDAVMEVIHEKDIELLRNVSILLEEQEAVKPKSKSRHGEYPQIVHRCGNCNEILYRYYKYCPMCGRSVKWDA